MQKQSLNNFQEVKDNKFTKRVIYKNEGNTAFTLNFLPGQQLPAHTHPGADLYITVMKGKGVLTTDGQETSIATNDIVHCKGTEELSFLNNGDDAASLLVVLHNTPGDEYAQDVNQ